MRTALLISWGRTWRSEGGRVYSLSCFFWLAERFLKSCNMNVTNSTGAEGLAPWNFNGKLRVKVTSLIQYGTKELEKKAVLLSQKKYISLRWMFALCEYTYWDMSKATHICECSGVIQKKKIVHDDYVQGLCYCLSSQCNFVGPFTSCVSMSWKSKLNKYE